MNTYIDRRDINIWWYIVKKKQSKQSFLKKKKKKKKKHTAREPANKLLASRTRNKRPASCALWSGYRLAISSHSSAENFDRAAARIWRSRYFSLLSFCSFACLFLFLFVFLIVWQFVHFFCFFFCFVGGLTKKHVWHVQ